MRKTTLIYVFNPEGQILLCMKKRVNSDFTVALDKRNGPGWKVEWNETILQGAIRELEEETTIKAIEQNLTHSWILHFTFETKKDRDQECHLFVMKWYDWGFEETLEMRPQWFDIQDIPYDAMREDDKYWMPLLLENKFIEFQIHANDDGSHHTYTQIKP